ncbi:MAG: hypothetical protein U0T73_02980 [Chitinophagales bacterium]
MQQTKLFQILQQLSPAQRKQLEQYATYKGVSADAHQFLQLLVTALMRSKTRHFHREHLFRELYPKKTFNDGRIRYLTHELLQCTENFLAAHAQEHHQWLPQLLLLQQYRTLKLDRLFELQYREFCKSLENQPLRNADFFWFSLQAHTEFSRYLKDQQNRHVEPQIQKRSDQLDAYYLYNKSNIYIEALNYRNILKTDYKIQFTDLFEKVPAAVRTAEPVLHLQLTTLSTLTHPQNREHFDTLKVLLLQHAALVNDQEYNDLMTLARNYCIKHINSGDRSFERDLFELYHQEIAQIDRKRLPAISPVLYKNVVTLAIQLGKPEWIKKFSQTYQNHLPENLRVSLYSFNMAKYWFLKERYDDVIALLQDVQYAEVFDQLAAKSILLKAYFEKQEIQPFESLVHSFTVLVGDKKDLGYHGRSYLNFARFAHKLFLTPAKKRASLKQKIENENQLVEKRWLLEKVDE